LDWSPDNTKIAYYRTDTVHWFTIDVRTRKTAELIPPVGEDIHNVQFSPNGDWLSFEVPAEQTMFLAAWKGGAAGGRAQWIRIGEGTHPWWSADGKLLYFLSSRDGFACLWAQRIAPGTGVPAGASFAAHHFHSRRVADPAVLGWGLARDRFILPIEELTGNIWMARLE
jgi:hypothetical protein